MLKNVYRDDDVATDLINEAIRKPSGRPPKTPRKTLSIRQSLGFPGGTTRDRVLRRLRTNVPTCMRE
jgi:hypothetical protein